MSNIYLLSNTKVNNKQVINLPIFTINYIKSNIDLNKYDALIFTSKNAIYAIDSFNQDYKNIPSYLIAQKTANILKQKNGNIAYISNSKNGDDFANDIIKKLKDKKVLYIRAKKVVSDLQNILNNNNINCNSLIAYETVCTKDENIEVLNKNAKIIFTSPSSVKCFFSKYKWDKSYIAITIGNTTASYLPKDIKYFVSKDTSIDECILLASTV